ncbi:helicase-associated domain-containing protein [Corynebacterium auriscanis]|uniref:helicase-associated domain-containing protein n=1 Tax=Corynebacterium auriscanis TaxID=99807 RepID=UPI003CF9B79F
MTVGFPTFTEWLAGHTDQDLAAIRPTALHDVTDVASLRSIDLLLIHAATELDATTYPVTVQDVIETADELLNIAGTPHPRQPHHDDLIVALHKLAAHGFIYGPGWRLNPGQFLDHTPEEPPCTRQLKIAPTVASYFDPATSEAWALADHHRSTIPTADIPTAVDNLPARQRRLLQTLHASGGVGHSASVGPDGDPSAPLPTMVRNGLLDQLDDTTVRLSGRIAQYLENTIISEPGGDFLPTGCPHYALPRPGVAGQLLGDEQPARNEQPAGKDCSSQNTTASAVANAIQTILELTDLLVDLRQHPIEPLTDGGIGLRDLAKSAKRLRIAEADLTSRLTLAIETGLVATGYLAPSNEEFPSPHWGITASGQKFLDSSLADQWAQLLLAWSRSAYAPWNIAHADARAFEPQLFVLAATRARQCFSFCFSTPSSSPSPQSPGPLSPEQTMWRVNPAVAHTATSEMWRDLFSEARSLGLVVGEDPAISAFRLADVLSTPAGTDPTVLFATLSTSLADLLPAPVSYLIIQSDHTIMAPGLLSPQHAARLRSIAVQESSGMASVWRVTTQAILGAYAEGVTQTEVKEFLTEMTPGGWSAVPQSLQYTIADAERLHNNAAESHVPLHNQTPKYIVASITHPIPAEDEETFWHGEWETILSAVENQRRMDAAEEVGSGASGKETKQPQQQTAGPAAEQEAKTAAKGERSQPLPSQFHTVREIKQALRQALKIGQPIRVRFVQPNGEAVEEVIDVVIAEPARVMGVAVADRAPVQINISQIEWVRPQALP